MKILPTRLQGAVIIEPDVFADPRGSFFEAFRTDRYHGLLNAEFVQDNCSHSLYGVIRGLHYQLERPQGKLVWVSSGEIYDVAVDLREDSPTHGSWIDVCLSQENHRQLYIPPGFAHGFCAMSEQATVNYKCTAYYDPSSERTIRWDDQDLAIDWPIDDPLVSAKDRCGVALKDAPRFVSPQLSCMTS